MKENTKFLWMYVGILFSFALILIIFAGLSQSTDSEQTQGLKADITELSQKNTELTNINKELQTQIDALVAENNLIKSDADGLKESQELKETTDQALMNAVQAKKKGEKKKFEEILSTIDPQSLTEAQLYIYNELVSK